MDDRRLVEADNVLVNGQLTPFSIWFQTDFPFSTLALWAQWHLWGAHPGGYHAVNIILHALSALLLWAVLARLKIPGAWLAAFLFAVHPVCVNSVARIAEIKNTLSLPFFLMAILFYLTATEPRSTGPSAWRYGASLVAFVLALLSKTSTIMLPVILLACVAWRNRRIGKEDLIRTAPFFLLAIAFGVMSAWFQKYQAMTGPPLAPESFLARVADAGRIFWFYLGKAWFPWNLNLVYAPWSSDPASALAWLPDALLLTTLALAWWKRTTWGGPLLFGLGVYAVALFPVLGFFDSQFLTKWRVSDHLQYLPLLAPVALAAATMASRLPPLVFRVLGPLLIAVFLVLTVQRARVFRSEESLFRGSLAKNPAAWGLENDLGVLLAKQGHFADAQIHLEKSVQLNAKNVDAESNLGQVLEEQGQAAKAEAHFRAALRLEPDNLEAHRRFAQVLLAQGRFDEALGQLRLTLALSTKPEPSLRMEYANLLHRTGHLEESIAVLRQIVARQPDSVEALNNLAWLLSTAPSANLRNGPEAISLAERALRLPAVKNVCVPGTLAAAYAEAGRFPEAVATAESAIAEETSSGQARFAQLNRYLLENYYRAQKPFRELSAPAGSTR